MSDLSPYAHESRRPAAQRTSMKVPRRRQDSHVARMADFLRRVIRMLAGIVIQRLDQRRAGGQRMPPDECIIGEIDQIG